MIQRSEITAIGKFHKTHALKGELNAVLDIDSDFIDMKRPLIVDIDGIFVPFYCESVRPKGHFSSLVKLTGIDSGEEARQFVNKDIYALRTDVEEFRADCGENEEEGEYADDLVGYTIVDSASGEQIGEITGLDLSTANPLFIVSRPEGDILVPVADEFITSVDDSSQTISMSLPEGLLDINR